MGTSQPQREKNCFPRGPYTCTHTLAPQLPSPSARKTVSHGPIHLHPYTCTPTSQPQREKNCLPQAHTLAPQLPSPSARKTVSHRPIHLHPNFQAPAREKLFPTGPYTCTPTSQPQREKNCFPQAHTLAPQLPSPSARKTVSHRPIHLHPN